MKTYVFTLLLSFTALIFSTDSIAQKGSEGKIVYDIELIGVEEDNPMAAMLSDATLTVYFSKNFTRSDMDMGISQSITVVDIKDEVSTTLVEAMGTKSKIVNDLKELKGEVDSKDSENDFDVEYTDETKEIAGYECKKAILTTKETSMVLWVTEDINFNPKGMPMTEFTGIKGVLLEYEMGEEMGAMKMTATEVTMEKLDKSLFDLEELSEGYEELSDEQKEMMKKMSGQ